MAKPSLQLDPKRKRLAKFSLVIVGGLLVLWALSSSNALRQAPAPVQANNVLTNADSRALGCVFRPIVTAHFDKA